VVDRDAVVEQALHRPAELRPVGIDERRVVEADVARRGRRGALALERVQADMVVVVTGGQERGRDAGRTAVGGHAEPERVAIEAERAVEVRHLQVDVADADGGMDGLGVHGAQCVAGEPPAHRWDHLTRRAVKPIRNRRPPPYGLHSAGREPACKQRKAPWPATTKEGSLLRRGRRAARRRQ
jgi:hypothetical protein